MKRSCCGLYSETRLHTLGGSSERWADPVATVPGFQLSRFDASLQRSHLAHWPIELATIRSQGPDDGRAWTSKLLNTRPALLPPGFRKISFACSQTLVCDFCHAHEAERFVLMKGPTERLAMRGPTASSWTRLSAHALKTARLIKAGRG